LEEIGIASICRICSKVTPIKLTTAKAIIARFFSRYNAEALLLLKYIDCGRIREQASDALLPFLEFPLLREALFNAPFEGTLIVDFEGMLKDEETEHKTVLAEKEQEIQSLKGQCQILENLIDSICLRSTPLLSDIFEASSVGDLGSVAFLTRKDPSLVNALESIFLFRLFFPFSISS
jgi:hypothetical protein